MICIFVVPYNLYKSYESYKMYNFRIKYSVKAEVSQIFSLFSLFLFFFYPSFSLIFFFFSFFSFPLFFFLNYFFFFLWFYALNKTPLQKTGCLNNPYFFTGCSSIQFFYSPLFPKHSLYDTCVTYGTTCHSIGHHQVFSTQTLPREIEYFPRGDKYPMHVPLPVYLDYLQPV